MKTIRLIWLPLLLIFPCCLGLQAQNSLVGDGFGGRLWYQPYNYTVGSYSAYTICGTNRQLYGWGGNSKGQLGTNLFGSTVKPVEVPGMDNVHYYSTGYLMGAIKKDKSGWVWGNPQVTPCKVLDNVLFVDAGIQACAFVKTDGTVWSVGTNIAGNFGNGQTNNSFSIQAVKMNIIQDAVRTAQGFGNTAILLKNGEVWICGNNNFGGLGNGGNITDVALTPIKIQGLSQIIDIKATTRGFAALDQQGEVWIWGEHAKIEKSPRKAIGLSDIVAISGCADGSHFLALDVDQNCYAWGNNNFGKCGVLSNSYSIDTPLLVTNNVVDIMAGEHFSYLVKSDGSLWCAGYAGDIWLDLPKQQRNSFTRLDPQVPEIGLCKPLVSNETDDWTAPIDSSKLPIPHVLYFPNAFSPNGDAFNSIFRAIKKPEAVIENYRLRICNRWGETVFTTYDLQSGWNGQHRNEAAATDTYFYYCEYNQPGKGKQFIKGDVTLLR